MNLLWVLPERRGQGIGATLVNAELILRRSLA
jgi:GNAT superfamily N-acetyltransferase